MLQQNQSIYHRCKRKPSVYGSRHLTYDIPFPIDECNTDDIEIRRRPSKRDRRSLYGKSFNKSLLRTHSLNLRTFKKERTPVVRNVSSPTSLHYGGNRQRWVICSVLTWLSVHKRILIYYCFACNLLFLFLFVRLTSSCTTATTTTANPMTTTSSDSDASQPRLWDFRQLIDRMSLKRPNNLNRMQTKMQKPLSATNSVKCVIR